MGHENQDEGLIRRYLLGQLAEDELQRLEEKMMADNEFFNGVLLAEDEMIEEYVQGELSASDRAGFEASFLSTPEGRRQVTYAKALSKYVDPSVTKVRAAVANELAAERPLAEEPPAGGSVAEGTLRDNKDQRPAWWKLPAFVFYFRLATAAVVVVGLGLVAWWVIHPQPSLSQGLAALNKAYQQGRPIEPRISGFEYAPSSVTRGDASKQVDTRSLNRAERILLDEASDHPSAASHHALGRLYLAEKKFDDAIREFSEALQTDPNNAQLHSDYGAALLEIGKAEQPNEESGKSLETFARSLEHLSKAIEIDGMLLEALYNRALLYQAMMLPRQAEDDWHHYLEKDPNSKWSDEAKRHLKTIEEQISRTPHDRETLFDEFLLAYGAGDDDRAWEVFGKCHGRAGNFITERLIDNYLELLSKHESNQANNVLKALSYAGDLQSRRVADRFTSDLARFYEVSAARNFSSLIAARASVRLAQREIAQSEMHEALETYGRAKRSFDQIGDRSESSFAEYWIGICASQRNPQQGIATFQQLTQACEVRSYKSLAIRALNGLANSHLSLNSYSKAISYSRPSLSLARQTQDSYGCVLALSHLIGAYKPLGNFDECLNYLQAFLSLATTHSLEPVQACLCYAQIAWVLNACELNVAALDYQKAALEMALELNELTMICTSYVHLAMIEARLTDYSGALMNARRAFEIASQRSTEPAGLKMKAYALLHLGSISRQSGDLVAAIASYNQSIELYKQIDFPAFVYLAQKGLFASLAASGDILLAKEELDRTISYYETQRTKIAEQSNRDSFFDLEQDVYDLAIDFEGVKCNDAREAFEYSELSRGRSLLAALYQTSQKPQDVVGSEEILSIASRPLNLPEIQDRLPDGAQIVQYAVLEDKIISWVITKGSFKQVRTDTSLRELTKQVQECLRLVQDPALDEDLSRVNRQLYDALIGPVEPLLDKNKQLFIIPDKILSFLPFQSLLSPSNIYLISDYKLESSPSSSVLIACSDLAREKQQIGEESVLSVGITHFASREAEKPSDLRSAAKEARSIAGLYKFSHPLIEDLASKSSVMNGMSNANVVHFASHFIRNPFSPMRSRLLLASEGQGTRIGSVNADLASSEICRLKLNAVRLVVLSACQTGAERYYRGEGASSIARAFMTAGVPLVIASLWPVDSDATAELMIRFHRFRKRDGLASIEALREAQRSMLDGPDRQYKHPYYWAAFNLIGGYAEY